MRIDVLVEYDSRFSRITFSSKATQYSETRASNIGLSRPENDNFQEEYIEFVGEEIEDVRIINEEFSKEPSRKNQILRVVNPFEPATFEAFAAFKMLEFFSIVLVHRFYPKTASLRFSVPWLITYDLTLKVPGYNFFNPQKKAEFEKLLRRKFKRVSFIS